MMMEPKRNIIFFGICGMAHSVKINECCRLKLILHERLKHARPSIELKYEVTKLFIRKCYKYSIRALKLT